MEIKYHDNLLMPAYGADHTLADNWNPDSYHHPNDEYRKIYIRIDSKGFDCMNGYFKNVSDREAFYKTIESVLISIGFEDRADGYLYRTSGKEKLYIHPQNISGVVNTSKLKAIVDALSCQEIISVRWVDLYDYYVDCTDNMYIGLIRAKKDSIRNYLINRYRTTRCNKMYFFENVVSETVSKFCYKRVLSYDKYNPYGLLAYDVVRSLVNEIADEGWMIRAYSEKGDALIRTINKGEAGKRHLKLPA